MKTGSLNYLERKPTIQTDLPAPLLVLLHGYGSNEADLFSFAAELPKSLHIVSLQAPHELGYNSYAWYNINFDANQVVHHIRVQRVLGTLLHVVNASLNKRVSGFVFVPGPLFFSQN